MTRARSFWNLIKAQADRLEMEPGAEKMAALRAAEGIGRPLGSEAFLDRLVGLMGRNPRHGKPGRRRNAQRPNQFEREADARRFLDAMRARFEEFALSLHPDKTRLIEFGRFAAANREKRAQGKPETFNFLGFTHICGKSRAGKFQIKRKSRRDRVWAKLKEVKAELRRRMHGPIREQGAWLKQVVTGFCNYHAVPNNLRAVAAFRHHVTDLWRRTLRRRGQKHRLTWKQIGKLSRPPAPQTANPPPLAEPAIRRQTPKVGAVCGVREESWSELASESLVRSKPSRQDGSESCGRRGDAGSEA